MTDGYQSEASTNRYVLNRLSAYRTKTVSGKVSSSSIPFYDAGSEFDENEILQSTRHNQQDLLPQATPNPYNIDNDNENLSEGPDSSLDIEVGRGGIQYNRNTPSRPSVNVDTSDILLNLNSSHPGTPRMRKSQATERGTLRKNLVSRRVYSENKENTPPVARSTRKSQKNAMVAAVNSTRDSFAMPDVTGLTDVLNQSFHDPISKQSLGGRKSSSRQAINPYIPITGVPLPEDEKYLIIQIEALNNKMSKLERENEEQKHQLKDYEAEVSHLRAEIEVTNFARRPDSALGSDDGGSKSSRMKLQIENTRLEASVQRLEYEVQEKEKQIKVLEALERKSGDRSRSIINDADLAKKLVALERENAHLRETIDDLNRLNEELLAQLEDTRDHHDEETQNWTQKEMDLNRRATQAEAAIAENQDLKDQLASAKQEYGRQIRRIKNEADSRKVAEEAAKAQHAKLQDENDQLHLELSAARKRREIDLRIFSKSQLGGEVATQNQINEELRRYNGELRLEIERLKVGSTGKSSRSRSKSRTRREESSIERKSTTVGEELDSNSTTDLSEALLAQSLARETAEIRGDTLLSAIDPEQERITRLAVEQERLRSKLHRRTASAADAKAYLRNRTTDISIRSLRSQKQDMKDDTSLSKRSSIRSTNTRKHPVGEEMTSAFILPDFTLAGAKIVNPKITSNEKIYTPHEPKCCTVCARTVNPGLASEVVRIPPTIPISLNENVDIDATSRPSEDPLEALNRSIKATADEIVHLKIELSAVETSIREFDSSKGARRRKELHERLDIVNSALSSKHALLYSLYDVREGFPSSRGVSAIPNSVPSLHQNVSNSQPSVLIGENDDNLEDTTQEARDIIQQLKATRKVKIQSPPEISRNVTVDDDWHHEESDDSELPWEGFTNTTGSIGGWRRSR